MNAQAAIKATMEKAGIPFKEIQVYGSQIVVTSWSVDAANKWASLIAKFAKVRGIVRSVDTNKVQHGTRLVERHDVWRTFGVVA